MQRAEFSVKRVIGLAVASFVGIVTVVTGADFNGDGKDDVAVYKESGGQGIWCVKNISRVYFGDQGDIPVPGDYYGDSKAEYVLFRPSTGQWISRDASGNVRRIYYGNDMDIPLGDSGMKQSTHFFYDPHTHSFRAGEAPEGVSKDQNSGRQVQSLGSYAVAMGRNTVASGTASTAMGDSTTASGNFSTAIGGPYTTAAGDSSIAMGNNTIAGGIVSTAMGEGTTANGENSTAMGSGTTASGNTSTAMGLWTTAGGTASTAMGVAIEVSGDYSFGFGGDPESQGVDISDDHVFVIHGANVGMGNTGPDYLLEMEESGGGYYSASDHQWHNGSSKDIKQDIVPSDIDVSKVLESVKIVKYRYKTEAAKDENAPYHIGFIGEETTPLLSGKDQNSMATGDCIGLLLAAVKEQQETIETLNARLELLEKKLVELEIRD